MSVTSFFMTKNLHNDIAKQVSKGAILIAELRKTEVFIVSPNIEQLATAFVEANREEMTKIDAQIKDLLSSDDKDEQALNILKVDHANRDVDSCFVNEHFTELKDGILLETIEHSDQFLAVLDLLKKDKIISDTDYEKSKSFLELKEGDDIPDITFLNDIMKDLLLSLSPYTMTVYLLIEYIVSQSTSEAKDLEFIQSLVDKYAGILPTVETMPNLQFVQELIDKYSASSENPELLKDLDCIKDIVMKYSQDLVDTVPEKTTE